MPIAAFSSPYLRLSHSISSLVKVGIPFELTLHTNNEITQSNDDAITNVVTKTVLSDGMSHQIALSKMTIVPVRCMK